MIDSADNAAWDAAIRPNTKVFFFETPANPTLDIVDLAYVCGLAKAHGITTVVDNAFAQCGAYTASKCAIEGWSRVLREELRPRRIRVGVVAPGATDRDGLFAGLAARLDYRVRFAAGGAEAGLALAAAPVALLIAAPEVQTAEVSALLAVKERLRPGLPSKYPRRNRGRKYDPCGSPRRLRKGAAP